MTPTPFELATQAYSMGDLYNTLRFLLQDNLDLRTQIRALQNRAMGLPVVPDPDQEIGFVKELDKCGRCDGDGVINTPLVTCHVFASSQYAYTTKRIYINQ